MALIGPPARRYQVFGRDYQSACADAASPDNEATGKGHPAVGDLWLGAQQTAKLAKNWIKIDRFAVSVVQRRSRCRQHRVTNPF